ncbi:peptide chain release factor N(5)-glutamine methyltransferase [Bifidobacterium choloepi]|uniref:Release factor glutamine methyltransferase n=1 Tax=Bifidobacterium choloepi TaxID=2614131 RepID=A0A6I5N073_9BIFI|nr:peptide chain release factor N(5)-glutamine methyltransferase [Bifidobacterium choloepi]NEG69515.1 peptide chain release factor N(5)-glutamine methyltransferase [Bifidobacterium choloepi]
MTVDELIRVMSARLADAGVETPRIDAKLLYGHVFGLDLSGVDKAMLLGERLDNDDPATAAKLAELDGLVARRVAREPLQHIVGHVPFRYLDLKVGRGVFVPRQETELVVQEAIDWMTGHGLYSPRVVDLCAGSGAIGLSVAAEVPGAQVWGVEIDPVAAKWTRANIDEVARTHPDVEFNYHLECADATSDVTLAQLDGTVDVVISNPPYIPDADVPEQPEVTGYDPHRALFGGSADGMMIPEQIIRRAYRLLRPGGLLVMEHDITQADRTVMFAHAVGFADAHTNMDYTGRPRYLVAIKG